MSDNIESAVVAKINGTFFSLLPLTATHSLFLKLSLIDSYFKPDFGTARAMALNQINQPINHTKCIGTPVCILFGFYCFTGLYIYICWCCFINLILIDMAPELYLVQPYNNKVDVYRY